MDIKIHLGSLLIGIGVGSSIATMAFIFGKDIRKIEIHNIINNYGTEEECVECNNCKEIEEETNEEETIKYNQPETKCVLVCHNCGNDYVGEFIQYYVEGSEFDSDSEPEDSESDYDFKTECVVICSNCGIENEEDTLNWYMNHKK